MQQEVEERCSRRFYFKVHVPVRWVKTSLHGEHGEVLTLHTTHTHISALEPHIPHWQLLTQQIHPALVLCSWVPTCCWIRGSIHLMTGVKPCMGTK